MKILFLGTGAADWKFVPDDEMKNDRGENIRRTSSVIIDSHILIDPAPSAFEYAQLLGVDLSKITDIFITHTHSDHYSKDTLQNFVMSAASNVNLWYNENAAEKLYFNNKILPHPLKIFEKFCERDFSVTALFANHIVEQSPEQPLHYYFEIGTKKLFYGCDGAWLVSRTCDFLMNKEIDCVILDATVGDYNGDFRLGTHNSIPMVRMIVEFMYKNKAIKPDAKVIISHLARTLHTSIAQTTIAMAKENIITAYDSMEIEI